MHYVPCDACDGKARSLYCEKCDGWGSIAVPDVRPNPAKALRLLTRVFVFLLWLAGLFVVAYEIFGCMAKR